MSEKNLKPAQKGLLTVLVCAIIGTVWAAQDFGGLRLALIVCAIVALVFSVYHFGNKYNERVRARSRAEAERQL